MRIALITFFTFFALSMLGQELTLEKLSEDLLEATTFYAVDDYNAYYYAQRNTLHKRGNKNKYQFTALQLGKITSVDVLNPLRITVFYEESNTAVILDNTLSEIARINFSTIENFRNVSHATTASDRRLWIFNTDEQRLEIFDWNMGKVITQFPPMEHNASTLTTNFNFAWVVNESGVYHYNNYGSFITSFKLKLVSHITQSQGNVVILKDGNLEYNVGGETQFSQIKTPDLSIKQLSLNGEILYIYDGRMLSNFRLQSPK